MEAKAWGFQRAVLAGSLRIDLRNPKNKGGSIDDLITLIKNILGQERVLEYLLGQPIPVWIIIDTLQRSLNGGNDNDAADMGAFIASVDRLCAEFLLAHVTAVHHTGKDAAKGARGHSSLKAAADTEIEVVNKLARVTKQRDGEIGASFAFALEPGEIGRDAKGRPVRSAVVVPAGNGTAAREFALPPQAKEALDVLRELRSNGAPVTETEWREACRDRLSSGDAAARQKAFRRALKKLIELGHITIGEDGIVFGS